MTVRLHIPAAAALILALSAAPALAQSAQTRECEGGNQRACAALARSGSASLEVREAAVRRITDQALLADMAASEPNRNIRLAAIRGLVDQTVLTDIARHAKGAVERGAAIDRLTSQATIADIARTDPSRWVRRHAAYCLTDQKEIDKLVAEGRKELLPTLTAGGGIRHVTVDGKPVKETLLGVTQLMPGRHTITADFVVLDNVTWDANSVSSVTLDARLGASYILEGEVGIVTWVYLSPQTRRGHGTWTLVVREEVSPGPDLLPQWLRR